MVRQRDGFGCIYCGSAIYDYDHFDPPFAEAIQHDATGIILLCPTCHRKKGSFLSIEAIEYSRVNPKCRSAGFSFDTFDLGAEFPEIHFGNLIMRRVPTVIDIFGDQIFCIEPPEENQGPFRISARLFGPDGGSTLDIVRNEWRTPIDNWDVEVAGGSISIRQKLGTIVLALRSLPPNVLVIERMNFAHLGVEITINPDRVIEVRAAGRVLTAYSAEIEDCAKGLVVSERGLALGEGGRGKGAVRIKSMIVLPDQKLPFPRLVVPSRRNDLCFCGSYRRFKHCHGIYR